MLPPVLVFPMAAVAMNGLVYGLGWNQERRGLATREPLLPPGYVIAIVWIVLFALMGIVYGRMGSGPRFAILGYAGYCLAYPLLTDGLRMGTSADQLNVGAFLGALAFVGYLTFETGKFPLILTPLLVWTAYVNAVGVYRNYVK